MRSPSFVNIDVDCLLVVYYFVTPGAFASPKELLENEKSFLRALVDESDDKERPYAMAEGK